MNKPVAGATVVDMQLVDFTRTTEPLCSVCGRGGQFLEWNNTFVHSYVWLNNRDNNADGVAILDACDPNTGLNQAESGRFIGLIPGYDPLHPLRRNMENE